MPIISVVVPCYKQAEFLSDALDSVLFQTLRDWECIIVNDGSPDDTESIAKKYCSADSRFKYVYQENGGLSAARNKGIASSRGKYILPLDADDKISPTYLSKSVAYLDSHTDCKLVSCRVNFFGAKSGEWKLPSYDFNRLIWGNCIVCSCIYRRCDFDSTGGYNTNMKYGFEDWDFLLCLLGPNDKIHRINEILFHYRIKETSMLTELQGEKKRDSLTQIYNNHPDIYGPYMQIDSFFTLGHKAYMYDNTIPSFHRVCHLIKKSLQKLYSGLFNR